MSRSGRVSRRWTQTVERAVVLLEHQERLEPGRVRHGYGGLRDDGRLRRRRLRRHGRGRWRGPLRPVGADGPIGTHDRGPDGLCGRTDAWPRRGRRPRVDLFPRAVADRVGSLVGQRASRLPVERVDHEMPPDRRRRRPAEARRELVGGAVAEPHRGGELRRGADEPTHRSCCRWFRSCRTARDRGRRCSQCPCRR